MTRRTSTQVRAFCLLLTAALVWQTQAWGQTQNQSSGIYACVDAKGRKLTADRPIAECSDREQRELGSSGAVKRTVGPALTPQEVAAREAQQRQHQEELERQKEIKRRENAYLALYPNRAALDRAREDSLAAIRSRIHTSEAELSKARQQREQLSDPMAQVILVDPVPPKKGSPANAAVPHKRQVEIVEARISQHQAYIREQEEEKNRVNTRFDADLVKLTPLWSGATSATR